MKIDLEDIITVAKGAEELKPIWNEILQGASVFLPDIKAGAESLVKWMRQQAVEAFKFYVDNGFTRDEAMLLILSSRVALERAIHSTGKR